MLASGKMVGFVPTKDYDKARAFYEGKLGFEFVSLDHFALVVRVGGHTIRISKIANFTPLQGTILGWEVHDIQATAKWLKQRGVDLEKYPFVQGKELGIWTTPNGDKVGWFIDPDGNILPSASTCSQRIGGTRELYLDDLRTLRFSWASSTTGCEVIPHPLAVEYKNQSLRRCRAAGQAAREHDTKSLCISMDA